MHCPLISCIVPAFNGERYLRDTLNSILAQGYRHLEVIVADDGSTDGTAAVVAAYGSQVRYVWQLNKGPAAARNLGLDTAKGDFIAFLDQDDLWHPDKLTRQFAHLESRPQVDACVTHVRLFWDEALWPEEERFRGHRLMSDLPGYITGTLLARRRLFETVGPFDTDLRYGDAMGWFLHAAEHGATVELLQDVLLYHRMHRSNLSRREAKNSRDEFLHILKASLDRKRGRAIPLSR